MNNGRTTGAMKRVLQLLTGQGASGRVAATLYPHYAAHDHHYYPPGCEQKHAPRAASTRLPRRGQRRKSRGFEQGCRPLLCGTVLPQFPLEFPRVFRPFCGRNRMYLTFGTRPEGARYVPSARAETVWIKRGCRRTRSRSRTVAAPDARWAHCAVPPLSTHQPGGVRARAPKRSQNPGQRRMFLDVSSVCAFSYHTMLRWCSATTISSCCDPSRNHLQDYRARFECNPLCEVNGGGNDSQ